jgi:hypothetical protein
MKLLHATLLDEIVQRIVTALQPETIYPDFSVVLFRPNSMLVSEEHPMKMHKNQCLLTTFSPPNLPWGTMDQGTPPGAGSADACAMP